MRLLLCSDFANIGYKYLDKFFDLNTKHSCLFVGYAHEDDTDMNESFAVDRLLDANFDVEFLTENFDTKKIFDLIFVRGGNTTKLIHYLKKYKQFEYLKDLVEKYNSVYVGNSAGSVLAGSDTEWTIRSEPYSVDLKRLYGGGALLGFGFVKKLVFVHCSKLRLLHESESIDGSNNWRVWNGEFYGEYLKDRKLYSEDKYMVLGNNQVLYRDGKVEKILTYNWSKIPVDKNYGR